jgi:hypothetical protein
MHVSRCWLAPIIMLMMVACNSSGGDTDSSLATVRSGHDWSQYEQTTLAALLADTGRYSLPAQSTQMGYSAVLASAQHPSKVQGIYTGDFQKISEAREFVLWEAVGTDPNSWLRQDELADYLREGRFTANGTDYWIALPSPLIDALKQAVNPNTEVTLYVLWLGAVVEPDGSTDHVIAAQYFEP